MPPQPNWKTKRSRLSDGEYRKLRERVFRRDSYRCVMCGSLSNLHMHHVRNRSQQGPDTYENCVTLDFICHDRVHRDREFRRDLDARFAAMMNLSPANPPDLTLAPRCKICNEPQYKLSQGRCDRCRVYVQRVGTERPQSIESRIPRTGKCSICGDEKGSLIRGSCPRCHYYQKRYTIADPKLMISRRGLIWKGNHPYRGLLGQDHPSWRGAMASDNSKRHRAWRRFSLGPCERCGNPGTDRHHRNGNLDDLRDIAILCRRCHMQSDGRLERLKSIASSYKRRRSDQPCNNCGAKAFPLRKGRCHRCNEYLRRNCREWYPDSRKPSILTKEQCEQIINADLGHIQGLAARFGISRSYAYVIRCKGIPKRTRVP